MAVAEDQIYSSLEAVAPDLGKQVATDNGKQIAFNRSELEVTAKVDFFTDQISAHPIQDHQPPSKKWIAMTGAAVSIVTLAVILGAVLGSRHTTPSKILGTQITNESAPPPHVSPPPPKRNIAAISFNHTFNHKSVNTDRVYFIDSQGNIMEAAKFEEGIAWQIGKIGTGAKIGSAIATSVSRPKFPLRICVFYLDVNNLIHDIVYTPINGSRGNWTSGSLSDQGYIAMPNSSLTAMHNECTLCANTSIFAFQDKNGFIQFGNLTTHGWTLTQLGAALDPKLGTGLALQPFYRPETADQINIYYQKSYNNLSLASWKPALPPGSNEMEGWNSNEQTYQAISPGSPIAAAASYSKASTGYETWIEVLFFSNTGITVNTWSGAINDWAQMYVEPSVMANSTGSKKVYDSLSVTALGNAYALVKQEGKADTIEIWRVEENMVDWKRTGNFSLDSI